MSNFWKILLLILLNVAVSASVTYGVLYYWDNIRNKDNDIQIVIVEGQTATVQTAAFVNDKTEVGALKIKKSVTVNGLATTGKLADSTYY